MAPAASTQLLELIHIRAVPHQSLAPPVAVVAVIASSILCEPVKLLHATLRDNSPRGVLQVYPSWILLQQPQQGLQAVVLHGSEA